MFDENKLREEIARVWGQYGAHMEVYDMLLQRAQVKHELIASANREHEYLDKLEALVVLLNQAGVRKYTCINGWGYSQLERDIVSELTKETYTREEVYLVAERSVHAVINNLLTDNRTRTMKQVIDSEIDTVKLF